MTKPYLVASEVLLRDDETITALIDHDASNGQLMILLDPSAFELCARAIRRLPGDTQQELYRKAEQVFSTGKFRKRAVDELYEYSVTLIHADEENGINFLPEEGGSNEGRGAAGEEREAAQVAGVIFVVVVIVVAGYVLYDQAVNGGANTNFPNPSNSPNASWPQWLLYYGNNPPQALKDFQDYIKQNSPGSKAGRIIQGAVESGLVEEFFRYAQEMGDFSIHGPNDPNGPIKVGPTGTSPEPDSPEADKAPEQPPMA